MTKLSAVPGEIDRCIRIYVFQQVAETARVPSNAQIAAALGKPLDEIEAGIQRLAEQRVWILAPGTANIWVANPFCAVPSSFRVHANNRTYWAICAWDAFGIPAALGADATITTKCEDCGEPIIVEISRGAIVRGDGVVHFAVPAKQWWSNIAFT